MASKLRLLRSSTTGNKPSGTALDVGLVGVHLTDRKLYALNAAGDPVTVADRITDFSATRAYDTDDIVIHAGVFKRANTDVSPGPFSAADWDDIGGGGGGGSGGAVLLNPTSPSFNTIDTTLTPSYAGLIIQGGPAQTGDLLRVPGTTTGDTRTATINSLGFPVGRFAPNIFRVSQPSHPFAYRGQAAAYTGGQWVLSNAAITARKAIALVEQVIDANTVVLRTGGLMEDLQTSAFAGGIITAGTLYYVSDTVAGQLTSTAPASRPDPVLYAISATSGVAVVGSGSVSTEFVRRVGDTMTGPLLLDTGVQLRLGNTSTHISKTGATPSILFGVSGATAGRVDEDDVNAGYAQTLMTRRKSDARYLQLSGGVLTGPLEVPAYPDTPGSSYSLNIGSNGAGITAVAAGNVAIKGDDSSTNVIYYGGDGGPDTAPGVNTILSRKMADNRYLQLSGGTLTGTLRVPSGTSSNLGIEFGNSSNGIYFDAGTRARFVVGGSEVGRIDTNPSSPGNDLTLLTRGAGDGRYVRQTFTINANSGLSGGGSMGGSAINLAVDSTVMRTSTDVTSGQLPSFSQSGWNSGSSDSMAGISPQRLDNKLRDFLNINGNAPVFGVRAWVYFQGRTSNGNCTRNGQGNVTQVEREASGQYYISFNTNMPDNNYGVSFSSTTSGQTFRVTGRSAGGFRIICDDGDFDAASIMVVR